MNNWCICWFFTHILLRILIFKGLTVRRLYKSFGVKGLNSRVCMWTQPWKRFATKSLTLYTHLFGVGPILIFRFHIK
jgi:hypothetical protein